MRGERRLGWSNLIVNFITGHARKGWHSSKDGDREGRLGGAVLLPILSQAMLGRVDNHLKLGGGRGRRCGAVLLPILSHRAFYEGLAVH